MTLEPVQMVLLGLLLAVWTLGAGVLVLRSQRQALKADTIRRAARRLSRMVDESPAVPLLVRTDGRIEAPERLAAWLGLDHVPGYLSELDEGTRGLTADQLAELEGHVRHTQKTAAPFRMVATPRGSTRSLAIHGHLADAQVSPGGAALVWFFDFSDSHSELVPPESGNCAREGRFRRARWPDRGRAHADVVPRAGLAFAPRQQRLCRRGWCGERRCGCRWSDRAGRNSRRPDCGAGCGPVANEKLAGRAHRERHCRQAAPHSSGQRSPVGGRRRRRLRNRH